MIEKGSERNNKMNENDSEIYFDYLIYKKYYNEQKKKEKLNNEKIFHEKINMKEAKISRSLLLFILMAVLVFIYRQCSLEEKKHINTRCSFVKKINIIFKKIKLYFFNFKRKIILL